MQYLVVDEKLGKLFKIRPTDIAGVPYGAFCKVEAEVAAQVIITHCQPRGWVAFHYGELRNGERNGRKLVDLWYGMDYLNGQGIIPLCQDGKYRVTDFFINQCAAVCKQAIVA